MKKNIFLLLFLGFFLPGYSFAAMQNIHIEWTDNNEAVEGRTLAGYYLYKEGVKVCTENTPTSREMDCSFESDNGTFNFTITAFCTDGYESHHSSPFSFELYTPPEPVLTAVFTTNPTLLSGETPFTVSFDATGSTGNIVSYSWDYGDNTNDSGSQVSHTYHSEGTFNATLTVTDDQGSTNQKTVTITTVAPTTPPSSHNIHIEWTYDYQPVEGRILAGYHLYKEGTKICTSNNPSSRSMDCTFDSVAGTFDFTITAFCTDGYESSHSSPLTFTLTTSDEPDLVADFSTNPTILSGNAPFSVSFNASISTGDIESYSWNFGNNNTGSGQQVSHTYHTAGTFDTVLTVTSNNGSTSQKSVNVVVNTPPAPPVAVITPGIFSGTIPLTVSFDGTASTGDNISHSWNFGDNNTGSGQQATHIYTTAGTFNAVLTVTDSHGVTSQQSVTVTATPPPVAVIGPGVFSGDAPLTVSFNGSSSSGNITSYSWNFGNNNTGSGQIVNHTYTTAGTFVAVLTVTDSHGATSQQSVTVEVTTAPPVAIISPAVFTGDAPFTVAFDGSTSTSAVSYAWFFGDGSTANTSTVNHTFTTAGTYTTTLTVTNAAGQTHSTNVLITVNEVTEENTPPTATFIPSSTTGDAPHIILFDGSGSNDAEGPINTYLWNFGDGSQPSTAISASHNYTEPGTFNASLTVTDSHGLSDTASIQITINEPVEENLSPTAGMTTSVTGGPTPLEVLFDGSSSTDPENSQLTYTWNFGDGTDGQGITATHIYTDPGSFTATLTVTDEAGASSSTATVINAGEEAPPLRFELGEVEVNNNWVRVEFSNPFINPIVVAGSPSKNDNAACVVRIKNINTNGFDIRLQEWTYLDGTHGKETVAYFVMETGNYTLDDGTLIEAGQFTSTNTRFQDIQFNTAFTIEPVVMTSIVTFNEEDTVTSRLRNITTTSFAHKTQEQEISTGHGTETVNYIAIEPTRTSINNIDVIVDKTADKVKNRWYTVDYKEQLPEVPIFLGTMQSQDGGDTAAIRYTDKSTSTIKVMVEEEQSKDAETRHTSETVGYFLFSSTTPEPSNIQPTAAITTNTVEGTTPLSVSFDGSDSMDEDGSIVTYHWDFGDGNTSTGITTSYVFTEVAAHTVTLTVTDDKGATDQAEVDIIVQEEASTTYQLDTRISSGTDDAEENSYGGMYLDSSDLELVTEDLDQQIVGLRFVNISIPQGAQITDAYIEFETDEASSDHTSLIISGEDSTNPETFTNEAKNISTRNTIGSGILWDNIAPWNTVNQKHQTPDLTSIVQQLIDKGEWTEGNPIVFIITGDAGCRTAESYDGEPDAAPLLHIEYQLN